MKSAPNLEDIMDGKARDLDSAQIDFTPLFQCIHIHDVLNKRVQLKLEFDESRRVICTKNSYKPMLFSLKQYLH